MAKKKHKQQKRKPNGSALKSGQKINWEAEARSVFNYISIANTVALVADIIAWAVYKQIQKKKK